MTLTPYTLQIKDAAIYFGYHPQTLYGMVSRGELIFGTHFIKVGGKVLIKTRAFKQWMHEQAGVEYGND